jgi:hypothetical protein
MSDSLKPLIPAATFAVGATALGCSFELWDRARTTRTNAETKETGSNIFWYAAGAAFVGIVLMFRGAQDFSE